MLLLLLLGAWALGFPLDNPVAPRNLENPVEKAIPSSNVCLGGFKHLRGHTSEAMTPIQARGTFDIPSESAIPSIPRIVLVEVSAPSNMVIQKSLKQFDIRFGLPPADLHIFRFSSPAHGHGLETLLDVELVHVVAPKARIFVVEASSITVLLNPWFVGFLNSLSPTAISISYDNPPGFKRTYLAMALLRLSLFWNPLLYSDAPVFVASGDYGATITYPAGLPNVLAVGGTLVSSAHPITLVAWPRSTGGYDAFASLKPSWQTGNQTLWRGIPDVSFVAGAYWVGLNNCWYTQGGTSASAPILAALWALGNQLHEQRYGTALPPTTNRVIYSIWRHDPHAFIQAVSGSNGAHRVRPGWNAVTGIGSPNVPVFVRDLGNWQPGKP